MRSVGLSFLLSGVLLAGCGFWLDRRYGAAIRHQGILRPYYPWWQEALAFLGDGLVLAGLITLMIGIMVAFL